MWLAVLVPLASQLRVHFNRFDAAICNASAASDHAVAGGPGSGHAPASGSHFDACGYCGLLAHQPLARCGVIPSIAYAQRFTIFLLSPPPCRPRPGPRYQRAYSRAPPAGA
jgi:hypothetical protein